MCTFDLSIIIINWKSKAYVRQCLTSIHANVSTLQYEVIVVDNASDDGCEEMIQAEFPDVTFIQSGKNVGFAGANNLAFTQCHGRNILFLNPDTEVLGTAVQKLYKVLDSTPDAGMVGARLLNSDLSLQTTCITALPSILNQSLGSNYLRRTFPRWRIWGMQPLFLKSSLPVQVEAISGACMLAKRDVLQEVGCFTTDFFMYSEDMDLCVKVAKTGAKLYYVPEAEIVHHAAGSSSVHEDTNFSNITLRESLIHYLELHRGKPYAFLYRICTAFISIFRLAVLAMISPIAIHPRGFRFLSITVNKWLAILAWSFGMSKGEKPQRAPSHEVSSNNLLGES